MYGDYSFRKRMLFSFWILLLAALLLPPWYYLRVLTAQIQDEAADFAVQQLDLIQWLIEREDGIQSDEQLHGLLAELGTKVGMRLTYVANGGKVIADSQLPFSEIHTLENHASRSEIAQTQTSRIGVATRFSGTTGKELMYTAKRVPGIGVVPPGVLRLASPLSKTKEPVEKLRLGFFVFLSLVFIAIAALSYLLVRRLNRPIHDMIKAAEAISSSDYSRRIHFSPGHEFYPLTKAINRMAESIQNQITNVTEQKQELEAVFNAMQEGVMVLDARGRIKNINQNFYRLTFFDGDPLGRRPLEVIPNPELQRICDQALTGTEDDWRPGAKNLQIVLSDDRIYDTNIVCLSNGKGGRGAVAVFHEITELKRLEKVRQDFVANVSHELRTPLTSIKGYTETLLSDRPSPETSSSFLQVILRNTNHMVKMVEDLLQLARLEALHNPVELVSVNAASALQMAWRACQHHAEGKSVELNNLLPKEGVFVSADLDQLVQVFRNLLENAIRYSPQKEAITVESAIGADEITFAVRDNGPGISKKYQQRIFERFYRIDKHRGDASGSTGLGLAICRHILLNNRGRIWVQSPTGKEGTGTTFFFALRPAKSSSLSAGGQG